ncbi:MAG TPA: inositol monophosphatase family protein [Achromobacter sp.]|uniref:inositol monophosphatase family protein n=1 Tax=unclassified Achromobacter TaxID=2626865 RepID=UPI000CFB8918|nr:inositol monophosphatase family protein [Achromobacter sp. MYb9]PQZ71670.1 inositol monophosphatase [Achromobacter sp. MYb9]
MTNTLDDGIAFAERLADEARDLYAPYLSAAPRTDIKPDRSLVTALDQAIEAHLRSRIESAFPGHGIYGEEGGTVRLDAEYVWVLDPIDGTAPFIAGIPVFGTLIALLRRGVPVMGLMDFPATRDRWVGAADRPTRHQGQPCRTRACGQLADAMLTTSNPDFYAPHELPAFQALRERTRWRIYGGCCLAYGVLASGRTDVAIDARLALYDYAPFIPVIQGAGGVITDWNGQPLSLDNPSPRILAAGDPARHREALDLVRHAMA